MSILCLGSNKSYTYIGDGPEKHARSRIHTKRRLLAKVRSARHAMHGSRSLLTANDCISIMMLSAARMPSMGFWTTLQQKVLATPEKVETNRGVSAGTLAGRRSEPSHVLAFVSDGRNHAHVRYIES